MSFAFLEKSLSKEVPVIQHWLLVRAQAGHCVNMIVATLPFGSEKEDTSVNTAEICPKLWQCCRLNGGKKNAPWQAF